MEVNPLVAATGADFGGARCDDPNGDGGLPCPLTGVLGPDEPILFGDLMPPLPRLEKERSVLPAVNPALLDAGDAKPKAGKVGEAPLGVANEEEGELLEDADGERDVSSLISIKGLGFIKPFGPEPPPVEWIERAREDLDEFERAEPGRRGGRSVASGASSSSESVSVVVEWELELEGCEVELERRRDCGGGWL